MSWLSIIAWSRRGEAHQQWAKEQGLSWRECCHAFDYETAPRWRDWHLFRARMLEAGDL